MLTILITAFLEGMNVLIVEIAGARALAPFFGTSLRVWTAQITATLLFLALGYGLGGLLCKRANMALPTVFVVAGGWLALYPFWRTLVLNAMLALGVSVGSFGASAWLFGPPLACMGAVSPLLIQRMGQEGIEGGQAAGRLFLTNTLGGLAGGWLTALVLIPNFSLRLVLGGVGMLLVAMGGFWARKGNPGAPVWMPLFACAALMTMAPRPPRVVQAKSSLSAGELIAVVHRIQSATGLVQVLEHPGVWRALLLDGVTQGGIEISSGASYYPFSDYLSLMTHRYHPRAKRVLLLGLGCGVLAKTLYRMGLDVTVAEIEPAVYKVAREYFGLPGKVHVVLEDARTFLAMDKSLYDVVILDAFAGENSPWYLVTREGLQAMKARLAPGGRVLVNSVTLPSEESEGLKRLEAGLLEVFGEALVFAEPVLSTQEDIPINATLVAGKNLIPSSAPYPAKPSRRVAPYLGDYNYLPPRPARAGATIDVDDHSGLEIVEADLRLRWRNTVLRAFGPELLQD